MAWSDHDRPGMPRPLAELARLASRGGLVVLTGAGCSTESGIPDYRGPETARRARNPIQYRGFVGDPDGRRRYWSRSYLGWPRIRDAEPNRAHLALAALERRGLVPHLITQNVDRLHQKAGTREVTELHGALAEVRCLQCQARVDRERLQGELSALNPRANAIGGEAAPDGDADLLDGAGADFRVPDCLSCGGVLKPDVVFFGEAVPAPRVERAREAIDAARALLVVGSSLAVYSGLRFVKQARARGIPTALVNLGPPARGLELFDLVIDAAAGPTLAAVASAIA